MSRSEMLRRREAMRRRIRAIVIQRRLLASPAAETTGDAVADQHD